MNHGHLTNELDIIKHSQGTNACKSMFTKKGSEQRDNAIELLNDKNLYFSTFYILLPEIEELGIRENLSERNQIALNFCDKVLNAKDTLCYSDCLCDTAHSALLWMFNTGVYGDGQDNEFDHIIDIVASILVKTHHEKAIIPIIVELIFKRNQQDLFIHDLVWACFLSRDVNALQLIAEYLKSPNSNDVELARTLLHLPQDTPLKSKYDKQKQYKAYLSWLNENDPYLFFTNESFNLTNNPMHCNVDIESKYLCKDTAVCVCKQLESLSDFERVCLDDFNKLTEKEKTLLAKHSQKLYRENPSYWDQWIKYPLDKQIQIVRHDGGNSYDCHC